MDAALATTGDELRRAVAETADVYEKVRHLIPEVEWAVHAPLIQRIRQLKQERKAVILAHAYQTPEIYHGVADITGDSLALARRAAEVDAEVIVLCGVHFMAETAKLVNPDRTVLIPDLEAGCSLATSITPSDVRELRRRYPGVPVVTYVNTTAAVKAECDVCCTSANAVEVVESLGSDRVVFLPDQHLGAWVAANSDVEVIKWTGSCEVHEQFTAEQLREYREQMPGITIIAHPECPAEVLEEADMVGSTSAMVRFLTEQRPPRVAMITECSMSDNVAARVPEVEIVRPCAICPHMKKITLAKIVRSLERMEHRVEVPVEVAGRARRSVERMLEIGRGAAG
jgi:quinolinate synthase